MDDNRSDFLVILKWVKSGSLVLDVGCSDGTLLELLIREKNIVGRGVEIDSDNVRKCISKGISVVHADIDEGMKDYKDNSFDYIIINNTLQALYYPKKIFEDIMRVGKKVIVNYPNFAYYQNRLDIFFKGRMPKSKNLPFEWYDTPNIHLFTIDDFENLCRSEKIKILDRCYLSADNKIIHPVFPNLFACFGMFMLSK